MTLGTGTSSQVGGHVGSHVGGDVGRYVGGCVGRYPDTRPPFSGPQGPFAGIAAGPDGTVYVSADGDGSVLAVRREAG